MDTRAGLRGGAHGGGYNASFRLSRERIVTHATVPATTPLSPQIPFINDLGVELSLGADGAVHVALTIAERHTNSWRIVHGGVLMSMLDVAMSRVGISPEPGARGAATIEMKTTFLRVGGMPGDRITGSARVLHRSTTLAFCEAELHDAQGQLVARASGTFKLPKTARSAS